MGSLRGLSRRVAGLLRAERIDREIDEEVRFHLDMRAEELVRAGMTPEEARREAERRFGRASLHREASRDALGGAWLEAFVQDVRFGARMLAKRPGFTGATEASWLAAVAPRAMPQAASAAAARSRKVESIERV